MAKRLKEKVSITLDARLLKRVDKLAELRGEGRSAVVELVLSRGIEEQEEYVKALENPLNRLVQDVLATAPPEVLQIVGRLVGERLSKCEVEKLRGDWKKQSKGAKERKGSRKKAGGAPGLA